MIRARNAGRYDKGPRGRNQILSERHELLPMWLAFPGLSADDPQNQGSVDGYIEYIWLPYWQSLTECEKAAYLDQHGASPEWRESIAERYEWEGFDKDGDPIRKTPSWLRRDT